MYRYISHNLAHNVWARESNWLGADRRHPQARFYYYHERNYYKSIVPRLSVMNVDKPLSYWLKFTPDGQQLLAFSGDQRSLEVYDFLGVGAAAHLLQNHTHEQLTENNQSPDALHIRQELFDTLFRKRYSLQLIIPPDTARYILYREFILFFNGGKTVLVCATAVHSTFPTFRNYLLYPDLYEMPKLYDYSFFMVDLPSGKVVNKIVMGLDYVHLLYNQCVSAHGQTLAILSPYRQCIDLYIVDTSGGITRLYTIGAFGSDMDRDLILAHSQVPQVVQRFKDLPLSHMKQKILAFQYQQIIHQPNNQKRRSELSLFYKNFHIVERMFMGKMQLIDEKILLIRYKRRDEMTPTEILGGTWGQLDVLYVFYDFAEQKILRVFENDNNELMSLLVKYYCDFCHVPPSRIPCGTSANYKTHFRREFSNTVYGRLSNAILPVASQSFTQSPYLDRMMYRYDEYFISSVARPKPVGPDAINFHERNTNIVKFRVLLEVCGERRSFNLATQQDLVTFIVHPYEPIFLSTQRFTTRYVMNIHIYGCNVRVRR